MIKISKEEAKWLRANGYEDAVKHTYTKHPKYYCVEDTDNIYKYDKGIKRRRLVKLGAMNALMKYRKSKIKAVYEG